MGKGRHQNSVKEKLKWTFKNQNLRGKQQKHEKWRERGREGNRVRLGWTHVLFDIIGF